MQLKVELLQHLLPQLGGAGEMALPTTMDYLILAKGQLPPRLRNLDPQKLDPQLGSPGSCLLGPGYPFYSNTGSI